MALILLLNGFIVAIGTSSICVRRVTVLSLFRFSATGLFISVLLLTKPLSATVLFGVESFVACVSEIRSTTTLYGGVYSLLIHDAFSSPTGGALRTKDRQTLNGLDTVARWVSFVSSFNVSSEEYPRRDPYGDG